VIDIKGKSVEELEELNDRGIIRRTEIPEYAIWKSMKARCKNQHGPEYRNYFLRGIRVYEEWRVSFWTWFHYIGRRPKDHLTQERIDNDGDYRPGNVRWDTMKALANNRRKDKFTKLTPEQVEEIRSLRGLARQNVIAEDYGLDQSTVSQIQLGRHFNPDGFAPPPSLIPRAVGEANQGAKLSERQVAEIKGLLLRGCLVIELADRYGVGRNAIGEIRSGKRWDWVEPNPSAVMPSRIGDEPRLRIRRIEA
jgi:transcriptional regulator with XRE-family HTH domain